MIKIKYLGISKLKDNESQLFDELFSVIQHADNNAEMIINNKVSEILVHIKPSGKEFKQKIVSNLLFINSQKRQYRIRFSSSLAISNTISFIISTESVANVKVGN